MLRAVAWHTGGYNIISGVRPVLREGNDMVLAKFLRLGSAIGALALVGGNDGFPLNGGERC